MVTTDKKLSPLSNLGLSQIHLEIGYYEFHYQKDGKNLKFLILFDGNYYDFYNQLLSFFYKQNINSNYIIQKGYVHYNPFLLVKDKPAKLYETLIQENGLLDRRVIRSNAELELAHMRALPFQNIHVSPSIKIYLVEMVVKGRIVKKYLRPDKDGVLDIERLILENNFCGIERVRIIPTSYKNMLRKSFEKLHLNPKIFDSNSRYGGSQNDCLNLVKNQRFIKNGTIIIDIVRSFFPTANDSQILELLEIISKKGCFYITNANIICDYMSRFGQKGEQHFKKIFGFDIITAGRFNIEALAVMLYIEYELSLYPNSTLVYLINRGRAIQTDDNDYKRNRNFYIQLREKYHLDMEIIKDYSTDNCFTIFGENRLKYFSLGAYGHTDYCSDQKTYCMSSAHSTLITNAFQDGSIEVSSWGQRLVIPSTPSEKIVYGVNILSKDLLLNSDLISEFIDSIKNDEKCQEMLLKISNLNDSNLPYGFSSVFEFKMILIEALKKSGKVTYLSYANYLSLFEIVQNDLLNHRGIDLIIYLISASTYYNLSYNELFDSTKIRNTLLALNDIDYYNLACKLISYNVNFLNYKFLKERFLMLSNEILALFLVNHIEYIDANLKLFNIYEVVRLRRSLESENIFNNNLISPSRMEELNNLYSQIETKGFCILSSIELAKKIIFFKKSFPFIIIDNYYIFGKNSGLIDNFLGAYINEYEYSITSNNGVSCFNTKIKKSIKEKQDVLNSRHYLTLSSEEEDIAFYLKNCGQYQFFKMFKLDGTFCVFIDEQSYIKFMLLLSEQYGIVENYDDDVPEYFSDSRNR